MLKGIVRDNIVSTRKQESLVGSKFLEVQLIENNLLTEKYLIAVDSVGAGIGELVLVATGSAARVGCDQANAPIDAAIVGIIDDGSAIEALN